MPPQVAALGKNSAGLTPANVIASNICQNRIWKWCRGFRRLAMREGEDSGRSYKHAEKECSISSNLLGYWVKGADFDSLLLHILTYPVVLQFGSEAPGCCWSLYSSLSEAAEKQHVCHRLRVIKISSLKGHCTPRSVAI